MSGTNYQKLNFKDISLSERKKPRSQLETLAEQAMLERHFSPSFSAEAQKQLQTITHPIQSPKKGVVRDLRDRPWISIDNEGSQDIDQLTYVEMGPDHATLYVAVADVDSLVVKGSALDLEAQEKATTVYTPSTIFPMLPDKLSHDFTSLKQDEDRLAIIGEVTILKSGKIGEIHFYQASVHNRAKLSYDNVTAWLAKKGSLNASAEIGHQIVIQDKLSRKIRTYRHLHGALSLEVREMQPVLSDEKIVSIRAATQNRAEEMIEDFMIVCNVAATQYLQRHQMPTLMRIVREPKNWRRIIEIARENGAKLTRNPNAKVLELFLLDQKRKDPKNFPDLSFSVVKLLGRGEYVVDYPGEFAPGHFGLALRHYTHATAPNRRYVDLLTQRLLKMAMTNSPLTYSREELASISHNCTIKEEAAEKIERRLKKSAAAIFLQTKIGTVFSGMVTGANDHTWVRISRPFVEGRIMEDYRGLKVGQRVFVKLVKVDVEKGHIDFARQKTTS